MDYIVQNVTFVAIAAFVLYSVFIYQITKVYTKLTKKDSVWGYLRPAVSSLIGGATGWSTFPWLFKVMGATAEVPWHMGMMLGVGAGAFASVIYQMIKRLMGVDDTKIDLEDLKTPEDTK